MVGKSKSKLKKELLDADILITSSWKNNNTPAPKLKLIQIHLSGFPNEPSSLSFLISSERYPNFSRMFSVCSPKSGNSLLGAIEVDEKCAG